MRSAIGQRLARPAVWIPTVAVMLILIVVGACAVTSSGFERLDVKQQSGALWANNRAAGLYAPVNLEARELGMPAEANKFRVSTIEQSGNTVAVGDGGKLVRVDTAAPQNLTAAPGYANGSEWSAAGAWQLVWNASSKRLSAGHIGQHLVTLDPLEPSANSRETAVIPIAGTIDDRGSIVVFSATNRTIYQFTKTGDGWSAPKSLGTVSVAESAAFANDPKMALFSGHWAILSSDSKTFVVDGRRVNTAWADEAVVLATSSSTAPRLLVSTTGTLRQVDTDGVIRQRVLTISQAGEHEPAAPRWIGTEAFAAWLPQKALGNTVGNAEFAHVDSSGKATAATVTAPLNVQMEAAYSGPIPTFVTNGSAILLNDEQSGRIWLRTGGQWKLVQSSLQWRPEEAQQQKVTTSEEKQLRTQNECPQPEPGRANYGVRVGASTTLPVLLKATDENPNDVVSIVDRGKSAPNVKGHDDWSISVTNNNRELAVSAPSSAQVGSHVTVEYSMTDGSDACPGTPATADVEVVAAAQSEANRAPTYISDNSDTDTSITAATDSVTSFNALDRWDDPDGDAMYVTNATVPKSSSAQVSFAPDGKVLLNTDHVETSQVLVTYTVSDGSDKTTTHSQRIFLASNPKLVTTPTTVTVPYQRASSVDITQAFDGGADNVSVSGVTASGKSGGPTITGSDPGHLSVVPLANAGRPGSYVYKYRAQRENANGNESSADGFLRVIVQNNRTQMSVAPITVFVSPDEDTVVDALATAENPSGGAMWIAGASNLDLDKGAYGTATVAGGSNLKVNAAMPETQGGRIGTFTFDVAGVDDAHRTLASVKATATVIQVAQNSHAPVAVDDNYVIRAGSQLDFDVLANDMSPEGKQLVLDPRSRVDAERVNERFVKNGGIAFASTSKLRVLAPTKPGIYVIPYTEYVANDSSINDTGNVRLTVVTTTQPNSKPQAPVLSGTVYPNSSTTIALPDTALDPDGDPVRITSVTQPGVGSARPTSDGRGIVVTSTAADGVMSFSYTLSDGHERGTTTSDVTVAVLSDVSPTPVAYTDYVEFNPDDITSPIAVDPSLNDVAPGDESLQVIRATMHRSGGSQAASKQITIEPVSSHNGAQKNTLELTPDGQSRTVYTYSIKSSKSGVATGTIIMNPVAGGASVPQYPIVQDSTVSQANISQASPDKYTIPMQSSVSWPGKGNITLGLWGKHPGAAVQRSTQISGTIKTSTAQTLVYSWTADAESGQDTPIVSYGFLHVPANQDVMPKLRTDVRAFTVAQGHSGTVNVASAAYFDASSRKRGLEFATKATASGARLGATCTVTSNGRLTYRAGSDPVQPTDSCTLTAWWQGQPNGAKGTLVIPINIKLDTPPPALQSRALGQVPANGKPVVFQLSSATTWQLAGGDRSTIQYRCDPHSEAGVKVTCAVNGAVTVTAQPDAVQGSNVSFKGQIIRWAGHVAANGERPTAVFSVTVSNDGIANLKPKALSANCDEGSPCSINILAENSSIAHAGSKLVVSKVSDSGEGTISASGGTAVINLSGAAGGPKNFQYTLADDARPTPNQGVGTIRINYAALPMAPTDAALTNVSGTAVTFSVAVPQSLPEVSDLKVDGTPSGATTNCRQAGMQQWNCTISGLDAYKPFDVKVYSKNKVGMSKASTSLTNLYAFKTPDPITIGASNWTPIVGEKAVRISFAAQSNLSWAVLVDGSTVTTGKGDQSNLKIPAQYSGSSVKVQAKAPVDPPKGFDDTATGEATAVYAVQPAQDVKLTMTAGSEGADYKFKVGYSNTGDVAAYSSTIVQGTQCPASGTGDRTATIAFDKSEYFKDQTVTGCVYLNDSKVSSPPTPAHDSLTVQPYSIPDDLTVTYSVDSTPTAQGRNWVYNAHWDDSSAVTSATYPNATFSISDLGDIGTYNSRPDAQQSARVCVKGRDNTCRSADVTVRPTDSQRVMPVRVAVSGAPICTDGEAEPNDFAAEVDGDGEQDTTIGSPRLDGDSYSIDVSFHGGLAGLSAPTVTAAVPPCESPTGSDGNDSGDGSDG